MEIWWGGSCDWSVGMEEYGLFRKGRQGRWGGGISLYISDQLKCVELCLGMDESWQTSWVRIKGRAGTSDITVEVSYRPPNEEDHVNEALYQQIEAASLSQALDFMGDFSHPDIYWKNSTAVYRWPRRFLECLGDSFFLQVIEEPTSRGTIVDHSHQEGRAGGGCEA